MTHRLDVARGRTTVARWCALAERRLEHLTELFETGRWRRYHSETAFLENIKEAKTAVQTWRDLLAREDLRGKAGAPGLAVQPSLSPSIILGGSVRRQPAAAIQLPLQPVRAVASILAESQIIAKNETRTAPASQPNEIATDRRGSHLDSSQDPDLPERDTSPLNVAALTIDFEAMMNRYPLLRNAL